MNRYINGMIAGIVVGATVGIMVLPQLDRKTQKSVRRAGKKIIDIAEDSYDSVREMI
ncbi:YtxH domain-containing protein [Clostridium vincentii]|uniref:YtxH-like protein n=1 Tax=Clostridium vincentii TaxID=52704 RepID=A0A2T0BEP3_9CLOT|nr:YtxH domain-containing protein [Clostridium vincentii]PRR82349.1 hypothetical protein CLVI_18550 [Clostridium vincentii]